jgi:hypothetical protein
MSSKSVRFDYTAPVGIERYRPRIANSVAPVVFVGEAAAYAHAWSVIANGYAALKKDDKVQAASRPDPVAEKARKEEIQGVFVISAGKAAFRKVETGITGATDIEVTGGLAEGDEIITGSYQVIRTIKHEAQVKVDNKTPVKAATNT